MRVRLVNYLELEREMKRQVMSYYVPIKKKISNFCTFLFLDFHYSEKERKKPSIGLSSQLCWTSLANEWISLSPPRMQQVGGLSSVIFTCILVVCRGNYVCPVGERTRKDEIATFYQKKKTYQSNSLELSDRVLPKPSAGVWCAAFCSKWLTAG